MKTLSVIKMSDQKLFAFTSIFIIWDLILLSIWQASDPLIASDVSVMVNDRVHLYRHCQSSGANSTGMRIALVLAITKGALIIFGALMSFATRRVSTTFNESKQIAITIYNIIFASVVIIPITLWMNAIGDTLILLESFLLLWIAIVSWGILFVPKLTRREREQ